MKKGLLILVLALLAGFAAFHIMRSQRHASGGETLLDAIPELEWMRGDLKLSDAQFSKAGELHAAYRPQCMEMCHRIMAARDKMEALAASQRGMTPELAEAIRDHARVRAECQERMLGHLYQTAALMDGKQAARYLEKVLPAALESTTGAPAGAPHH